MIFSQLFIITLIIVVVECGSYQHVRFFNTGKPIEIRRTLIPDIPSRHLDLSEFAEYPELPYELWGEELFPVSHTLPSPSLTKLNSFLIEHDISALTSKGPETIYDPFLLTGAVAKRAARILYSKELFFGDIPHTRALMYNQQMRKKNGLAYHILGSLRPTSSFYRHN